MLARTKKKRNGNRFLIEGTEIDEKQRVILLDFKYE
jgi:hypothetical protein